MSMGTGARKHPVWLHVALGPGCTAIVEENRVLVCGMFGKTGPRPMCAGAEQLVHTRSSLQAKHQRTARGRSFACWAVFLAGVV